MPRRNCRKVLWPGLACQALKFGASGTFRIRIETRSGEIVMRDRDFHAANCFLQQPLKLADVVRQNVRVGNRRCQPSDVPVSTGPFRNPLTSSANQRSCQFGDCERDGTEQPSLLVLLARLLKSLEHFGSKDLSVLRRIQTENALVNGCQHIRPHFLSSAKQQCGSVASCGSLRPEAAVFLRRSTCKLACPGTC